MAKRPLYIANVLDEHLVLTKMVEFEWFPGMNIVQKRKSIESFHSAARTLFPHLMILEISSKSTQNLGVSISSFNLNISTKTGKHTFSVESAYQSSKVFQNAGPFTDLLTKPSVVAKRDPRLKNSGPLIAFKFGKKDWPVYPKTAFYDWLYINALARHENFALDIMQFNAFTDIEFNPEKSINCQAHSAALFVSLQCRGLLNKALSSQGAFINVVQKHGELLDSVGDKMSLED